jgi:hypothetical protein
MAGASWWLALVERAVLDGGSCRHGPGRSVQVRYV